MDTVTVRFTTRWPWNPTSPIIARLGGSKDWSHCMTVIDGQAYEATMLHKCRAVPLDVAMQGVAAYVDMFVPVPDIAACRRFGIDQDGKDYDFAALALPILASEDWNDESKWWCSELTLAQLGAGGIWLLDPAAHARVRPVDLFQCNFPKSQIIRLK